MLAAVKGYYDGNQIIVDEADRHNLNSGDELIITILGRISSKQESRAEKRKRMIQSGAFVNSTGRTAEEIDAHIRELRENDRL